MEVKARAPGKIILSGEHAVVHGSTAVAASIDLFTYVTLSFATAGKMRIRSSMSSYFIFAKLVVIHILVWRVEFAYM